MKGPIKQRCPVSSSWEQTVRRRDRWEEVAAALVKAPLTADLLVCVGSLRGQSPGRPSCHLGCSLDEEWTAGVFDESEKKRGNRMLALIVSVLAKDKGKSSFQGLGG